MEGISRPREGGSGVGSHVADLGDVLSMSAVDIRTWLEDQPVQTRERCAAADSSDSAAKAVLDVLIAGSSQPKVSTNIRLQLCQLIHQCSLSESIELQRWAFSEDTVWKLFDSYLNWNESDQSRALRHILDTLRILLTRNTDDVSLRGSKRVVLESLVHIITQKSSKPLAQSAIKVLEHLFGRSIFTLEDLGQCYKATKSIDMSVSQLGFWRVFAGELFNWMKQPSTCPVAGKFIVLLYKSLRRESIKGILADAGQTFTIDLWHAWLLECLLDCPNLLEGIKQYIFLGLFRSEKSDALEFLSKMNAKIDFQASDPNPTLDVPSLLQLAALEVGKKVGLVEEPVDGDEYAKQSQANGKIALQSDLISAFLSHPSYHIRTLALSLLVSSSSTTKPYSRSALRLLHQCWGIYFSDSDAKFRTDILSKAKEMYKRVRGAIFVLQRDLKRSAKQPNKMSPNQIAELLALHEEFIDWYLKFLRDQLTPTASYQRHICSLRAVSSIIRMEAEPSKIWATANDESLYFHKFDTTWTRALLDILMDRFDEVSDMAALVLRQIFSDTRYGKALQPGSAPYAVLLEFLERAELLASRTGRSDHANGVARGYELLHRFSKDRVMQMSVISRLISNLEEKISLAETDLGKAVMEATTHGTFAALSHLVKTLQEDTSSMSDTELGHFQKEIARCCRSIWEVVRHVLCDDSPEGHLPEELEEVPSIDSKDLLSFSFRAIDESSKLIRSVILAALKCSEGKRLWLPIETFTLFGNLSFEQLSTLRHRGALTTVGNTFATCCQFAWFLDIGDCGEHPTYLRDWYKGTIKCINSQMLTTRRSAGLPLLVTGILSTNAITPSLDEILNDLVAIASIPALSSDTNCPKLPQVHALNSLKDIFKNSQLSHLGTTTEKHLSQCLQLAANSLKSEVWAIRNSGLLLIRSIMDGLFGTNENKTVIEAGWDGKGNRIHYPRYPTLPPVLLQLLQSGHSIMAANTATTAAESVFPALDIIRRAGPPNALRTQLQESIIGFLGSPVWHVRDMAARALCACLLHENWPSEMKKVIALALADDSANSQNRVHGTLLALQFLVARLSETMPDNLEGNAKELVPMIRTISQHRWISTPDIQSVVVRVINSLCQFCLTRLRNGADNPEIHALRTDILSLQNDLVKKVSYSTSSAGALLRVHAAIGLVYYSRLQGDIESLFIEVQASTIMNSDSLLALLETVPDVWDTRSLTPSSAHSLTNFLIGIGMESKKPDLRSAVLDNLFISLDYLAEHPGSCNATTRKNLQDLWTFLNQGPMGPMLSNAIIRASGPIMATLVSNQEAVETATSSLQLHYWGLMLSEALREDQPFDSRFGAAESLGSFFKATKNLNGNPPEECLSALLAIYDSLNDDDEEIREVGAIAASSIINHTVAPMEASNRLLGWLVKQYGQSQLFRTIVATRAVGQPNSTSPKQWVSATDQLVKALQPDESLFVIEKQNLFIDEVREIQRWTTILPALSFTPDETPLIALRKWSLDGLEILVEVMMKQSDGPLGWASRPDAFETSARIISASVAVVKIDGLEGEVSPRIRELLEVVQVKGTEAGFSGYLLEMAVV